jgi:cob(I)alamin adenosyltransferase
MKTYTRTGDAGQTSLFAGGRVSKNHTRLHAYGSVDELNSLLGVVLTAPLPEPLAGSIRRVQEVLFIVGADLATPLDAASSHILRLGPASTQALEAEIDAWEARLPALRHFILPGGAPGAALLHQARTVCRRAERWVVALQGAERINGEVLRYLNRLSDWLFVAARLANQEAGVAEVEWLRPVDSA